MTLRLDRGWLAGHWRLPSEWVAMAAALYFAVLCNAAFWHAFSAAGGWQGAGAWRLASALFIGTLALHATLLVLVLNRWTMKLLLPVLLLVTAASAYYMQQYAVYLDADMVRNILATEPKEAAELLTPGLVWTLALLGGVPSLLVWRWQAPARSPWRGLQAHALACAVCVALAAAAVAMAYQPLAAFMRNEKAIRHLITPGNWLVAATKVMLDDGKHTGPKAVVAADAVRAPVPGHTPRLLVLVVGETVRAQNWGLNGYARNTTPQIAGLGGIHYSDVTACGTSTEVSLPCMFSAQGLQHYDRRAIRDSQSLLHVLERVGVRTLWRDNQTGCKGVCSDLPFESFLEARIPEYCDDERCVDEVLLHGLSDRLAGMPGDAVVVLHTLGNHGPAYFRRYPPDFRRYLPECTHMQLSECSRQQIVNSYDNAVTYTDHVLARTVDWLRMHAADRDTAVLYLSDHGESLGEGGLYLHGVPRAIAPAVQLKVPMWLWLSPQWQRSADIDMDCARAHARKPLTHDVLFSTVLGLFDVRTSARDPGQDVLAGCRTAARIP